MESIFLLSDAAGKASLMQQGKHLQWQDRVACSGEAGCALARHREKCAPCQVGVIGLLIRTKSTLCVKKELHLSKLKEKLKLGHHGYLKWKVPAHIFLHSPVNSYSPETTMSFPSLQLSSSSYYSLFSASCIGQSHDPLANTGMGTLPSCPRHVTCCPAASLGDIQASRSTEIEGQDHCSCTDLLYYIHSILKASHVH